MDKHVDKQVNKLARQLRDEGVAPERDLLPGILDSIGDQEVGARAQSPVRPISTIRTRRIFNASAGWRLAAVAATLVLLFGSGYFQSIYKGPAQESHLAMNEESAEMSSRAIPLAQADKDESLLRGLNEAISDLASAQALDPDNLKLTRLSLLAHKSRVNFLRVGTRR